MRKIISLFLFVFCFHLVAGTTYTSTIEKIDLGTNGEPHLLLLSDGHVLKIGPQNKNLLVYYQKVSDQRKVHSFITNNNREVLKSRDLGRTDLNPNSSKNIDSMIYVPTVLNSMNEAQAIFKNLRKGARSSSQCYSRAHIWAFESTSKYDLNSMKVFVFYTRKYIREFNFNWWFHVSPFTYVKSESETIERVLDFKYSRGPLPMQKWTDIFIKNKVTCPDISKYSQYENNQESNYCYLYKESMYYFQPIDLKNIERYGKIKTNWLQYEIKRAYSNGFGL